MRILPFALLLALSACGSDTLVVRGSLSLEANAARYAFDFPADTALGDGEGGTIGGFCVYDGDGVRIGIERQGEGLRTFTARVERAERGSSQASLRAEVDDSVFEGTCEVETLYALRGEYGLSMACALGDSTVSGELHFAGCAE